MILVGPLWSASRKAAVWVKSPRLAEFLRYVCDRQLRSREAEITEQRIGVKVFGRPEGI